ncbi:Crp/Fnr family transcriptional regulator [Kaistia dalseonensis]|uniref:CRP-like cAMP-binding protein n=1 Tax=Kaistia dalseonensis TaxID=410840 RepID=A0ABU0H1V2_9HYPH|nr:Crp/Fnr family transcriptional regulator [Kaistia dalseonensis]MCX5493190.1 Crp/Fnr family transcriptional regulator [Kaistia dalseonensis]MDQ0435745.1 CRP-like cAMP-binding protein [Kaistia dalseonensis]
MAPDFRKELLAEANWRRFDAGQHVTLSGEGGDELLCLCEGALAITSGLGTSDTPTMLHLARPPFWLGYGPLMTGEPRRATATARTSGWLAQILGRRLMAMLAATPAWWPNMFFLAASYGDLAALIAADLAIRGSERRLIAVILRMSGHRTPAAGPPLTLLPISQGELAAAANMSRNTAGTIIQRLASRGLLVVTPQGLVVENPGGLASLLLA